MMAKLCFVHPILKASFFVFITKQVHSYSIHFHLNLGTFRGGQPWLFDTFPCVRKMVSVRSWCLGYKVSDDEGHFNLILLERCIGRLLMERKRGMKGITGIGYEYLHLLICFTQKWECIKYRAKLK